MQQITKIAIYTCLVITVLTCIVTLLGLLISWVNVFNGQNVTLPYLQWLLAAVIIEIVGVFLLVAKKGLKYLPETQIKKTAPETMEFMEKFIVSGSRATIVSNRVSWLTGNERLLNNLRVKIKTGLKLEIITPVPISDEIKGKLAGADFVVTGENLPPDARFTLVNGDRVGGERLAIARGSHPHHEITIFNTESGPQMIAMAKDIIRKSRDLSNAKMVQKRDS